MGISRINIFHRHATVGMAAWLIAYAPAGYAEESSREIQVFIENDFLAGTDRYYSNGLKIGFGAQPEAWPAPVRRGLESVRLAESQARTRTTSSVSSSARTSTPRATSAPPRRNRTTVPGPAGSMPAGRCNAWTPGATPGHKLDTLELNVGVIGPPALAKQVQTEWHKLIGAPEPRGWAHQLPTEPGFMLGYLKKWKFGGGTGSTSFPTPAPPSALC